LRRAYVCSPGFGAGADVDGGVGGKLSMKKSLSVIRYSMLTTTISPFSFTSTTAHSGHSILVLYGHYTPQHTTESLNANKAVWPSNTS